MPLIEEDEFRSAFPILTELAVRLALAYCAGMGGLTRPDSKVEAF